MNQAEEIATGVMSGELIIGFVPGEETPMVVHRSMVQQARAGGWKSVPQSQLAQVLQKHDRGGTMNVHIFLGAGRNGQRWMDRLERLEPLPNVLVHP